MVIKEVVMVLLDISGYTKFLTMHKTSMLHAELIISKLLESVIVASEHPLTLNKLEGDAAFLYAKTEDDNKATAEIRLKYGIEATGDGGGLTLAVDNGEEFLPDFIKGLGTKILSVNLRRPSLDDVFLKLTGREIRDEENKDYKSIAHHRGPRRH